MLACHRLPYKAAPAESNDGTAMIEDVPGFPIFWILPEKACREDSHRDAGFADCNEHAVAR